MPTIILCKRANPVRGKEVDLKQSPAPAPGMNRWLLTATATNN
uniref:Uncharacterized protein n=1 Tax=Klebsiella pneumoniae TaxID=573 RepID=A0A8D6XUM9_KLEPN